MSLPAFFRPVGALIAAGLLAGCSTLVALTEVSTPLEVFDLRAPENAPVASSTLALDVIVELPTTSGVLDTDRILIRPDAYQAQYLPDVRWGDETPVMMQTLMVRALQNTGGLRYVARRPLGLNGDFAIISEIIDFQAEVVEQGGIGIDPVVRVELDIIARMVRESDASIVSTRVFRTSVVVNSTDPNVLVVGFDRATNTMLREFAAWVMARLGRPLPPA